MRSVGWSVLGVLLAGPAAAADMPSAPAAPYIVPVPQYEWSGPYLGGNIGYHAGATSANQTLTDPTPPPTTLATSNSAATSNGIVGGVQLGINWQIESFVFGLEGDFDEMTNSGGGSVGSCQSSGATIPGCSFSSTDKLRYFATFRARAGFAVDRWLFFVTGGAVWQNVGSDVSIAAGTPSTDLGTVWNTPVGWVAGAGVEMALGGNWSARIEYLHLESINVPNSVVVSSAAVNAFGFSAITTITDSISIKNDVVRVGLNYRFW